MIWLFTEWLARLTATRAPWFHHRLADFVLNHSPYWQGYRAGLADRERAHKDYLDLQRYIE